MSRSSSSTWSGEAPPADIIDLDRFMRTARPSQQRSQHLLRGNGQLVVDAGSLTRKPAASSSGSSAVDVRPTRDQRHSHGARTPVETRQPRDKRFSHDSGLSDGSYVRRRHRPHRRVSCAGNATKPVREVTPRATGSTSSLRAFRTVCERALREQQQQIARVAQLCERLTERRVSTSPDTSEISSSSKSTKDQRRKDKHRTDECKTYKIIMTKLDELNRLFANRGRQPPPPPRARRPLSTDGSVSVSDKVVATEPEQAVVKNYTPTVSSKKRPESKWNVSTTKLVERAVGDEVEPGRRSTTAEVCTMEMLRRRPDCNLRMDSTLAKCDSFNDESSSSGCDPHCGFDLDDPVHFYAQAKRLQALHATTHRRCTSNHSHANSLCGVCRGYLRSLRHYLANQLFCYPTETCPC